MATHTKASDDWCGEERAAEILAKRIAEYWRGEGCAEVKVWVETDVYQGRATLCSIRSNMVRGFPPRQPVKERAA